MTTVVDRLNTYLASPAAAAADPLLRQQQLCAFLQQCATEPAAQGNAGSGGPALEPPRQIFTPGNLALLLGSLVSKLGDLQSRSASENIKLSDAQKQEAHKKAIARIEEMVRKIEEAAAKEKALGILGIIGKAFGLVAAIALTALTAGAAAPVLALATALLVYTVIDTVMTAADAISQACGGPKLTLDSLMAQGFSKLAAACGDDPDEAAKFGQWMTFALQAAIALAGIASGAGVYRAASTAASTATAAVNAGAAATAAADVAAAASTAAATAATASAAAADAAAAAAAQAATLGLDAGATAAAKAAAVAAAASADAAAAEAANVAAETAARAAELTQLSSSAAEAAAAAAELAGQSAVGASWMSAQAVKASQLAQIGAGAANGATALAQGGTSIAKGIDERDAADAKAAQLKENAKMAALIELLNEAVDEIKKIVERSASGQKEATALLSGAHDSMTLTAGNIATV